MNVQYINPFIAATQQVFRAMLGLEITHGKPFLLNTGAEEGEYDISGVIGLTGKAMGAVVISFTKQSALNVVSAFAGGEVRVFDQTVVDSIGELINIVAGNAKKDLGDLALNISLPSVITGHLHRLNWPSGVPVVTIPFQSEFGEFSIAVSLREQANGHS